MVDDNINAVELAGRRAGGVIKAQVVAVANGSDNILAPRFEEFKGGQGMRHEEYIDLVGHGGFRFREEGAKAPSCAGKKTRRHHAPKD